MDRRSILITGCSSGIGYTAARTLARRGYRIFATARNGRDVERLLGEGLESFPLDLNSSRSIAQAVEETLQRTGGTLYALFNNGAYGQPGAVEDLDTEVLRAQFESNFFGWHELTRRLIPVMRAQGEGRIVQNSSVLGFVALKYRGAYNATKFALEGLSDTLRMELAGSGIHVSLIEPGPIETRFRANAYAAFKRHIDVQASAHREVYAVVEARLANQGPEPRFTLPPDAVVDKLIHALESRRPRPRYYVTLPTHVFAMLRRLLPAALLDRVLSAASGAELKEGKRHGE